MNFGKRLRALRRAFERAGLQLRISILRTRLQKRRDAAQTTIASGEAIRDLGRTLRDARMIADGFTLMDLGHQQLNEIETGLPAEPRSAAWWQRRADQSAD